MPGPEFNTADSVVDWVIEYPTSAAVFREFGIDFSCAGKSLEYACLQAGVSHAEVYARLQASIPRTTPARAAARFPIRSLSYWVAHTPPGWISRTSAAEADPLSVAAEVCRQTAAVVDWMRLASDQRWDNYRLQLLSAALFNRYRVNRAKEKGRGKWELLSLLQLPWPAATEAVQQSLASMQDLLVAPLAVFKAVRVALDTEHCPSTAELKAAESILLFHVDDLMGINSRLHRALLDDALGAPPNRRSESPCSPASD